MVALPENTQSILDKREIRTLSKYSKWSQEISPQPDFGIALATWVETLQGGRKSLAAAINCTPETISRWCLGTVPSRPFRRALRQAGFDGDFYPLRWSQSQFVKAELVRVKNRRWREGDFEGREYIEKYCVTLRVQRAVASGRGKARTVQIQTYHEDFLFPCRVTDVIDIVSSGDAIPNWLCCQGLNHMVGQPVLRGAATNKDGVLEQVEIRGTWRKIEAWKPKCLTYEITLDQEHAHIQEGTQHTAQALLDFHRQAYMDRYRDRDRAGELGTRAHMLGHAWLKFHEYQLRDDTGAARINVIVAPHWWWYPNSTDNTLYEWSIEYEPIEVQQALHALETFFAVNRLTIVATELLLADVVFGVAGACDCIVRDGNGDLIFLDWKTSNGVYSKMLLQLAWYARLFWLCHGEMPVRGYVVRLDKKTAQVQVVPAFEEPEERQDHLEAALQAIHLFRWNARTEQKLNDLKLKTREEDDGGSE